MGQEIQKELNEMRKERDQIEIRLTTVINIVLADALIESDSSEVSSGGVRYMVVSKKMDLGKVLEGGWSVWCNDLYIEIGFAGG